MTSQPEFILTFFISWMILDALGCSRMLLDIIYSVDAQIMLRWCSVDVQMLWRFDARMLWCSWMLLVLLVLLALGCSSMLLDALGCFLNPMYRQKFCIQASEGLSIYTFEHLSIWGSEHLSIWPFEHLSIWALKHLNIWAIEHFNIWSSDHLSIWASEHYILLNHNVCHLKTLAFEHWCILWSQNEFWLCSHFLFLMW